MNCHQSMEVGQQCEVSSLPPVFKLGGGGPTNGRSVSRMSFILHQPSLFLFRPLLKDIY